MMLLLMMMMMMMEEYHLILGKNRGVSSFRRGVEVDLHHVSSLRNSTSNHHQNKEEEGESSSSHLKLGGNHR